MDPLPPLVPLTAHVEHVELDPVHPELGLEDAGGENSTPEDVLLGGVVVRLLDVFDLVEEVFGTVYKLEFIRPLETLLNVRVCPEHPDVGPELGRIVEVCPRTLPEDVLAGRLAVLAVRAQGRVDVPHGLGQGQHGVPHVLSDVRLLLGDLIWAEGLLHVEDLHLLDQRRLARLARAQ